MDPKKRNGIFYFIILFFFSTFFFCTGSSFWTGILSRSNACLCVCSAAVSVCVCVSAGRTWEAHNEKSCKYSSPSLCRRSNRGRRTRGITNCFWYIFNQLVSPFRSSFVFCFFGFFIHSPCSSPCRSAIYVNALFSSFSGGSREREREGGPEKPKRVTSF